MVICLFVAYHLMAHQTVYGTAVREVVQREQWPFPHVFTGG